MSKIQSNVQKAKEHERNLTSSTDALGQGAGVDYDGQTTCDPNRQMQEVYGKQQGQSRNLISALTRDASAISRIAASFAKIDHALAK